jgi:hypothetical protein
MVRNGKERENPLNLLVAATLEKAITYVFAESLIRNAEAQKLLAGRGMRLGLWGKLCQS